jgi:hypothetical protein
MIADEILRPFGCNDFFCDSAGRVSIFGVNFL